jgi:hypothetical protein
VPFKEYLLILASSDDLFSRGLAGIHHGQLKAYYECLLNVSDDKLLQVVPSLKAVKYYSLAGMARRGGQPAAEAPLALDDDTGIHHLAYTHCWVRVLGFLIFLGVNFLTLESPRLWVCFLYHQFIISHPFCCFVSLYRWCVLVCCVVFVVVVLARFAFDVLF